MDKRTLALVLICASISLAISEIPGVRNHWVANSGGTQYDHVQNFIEDMIVKPDGTVLTQSSYDEAQHPNSAYKNGAWIGFNSQVDTSHPSRHVSYRGTTWRIINFYGRAFVGKVAPSPTSGPLAPRVISSKGDTLPNDRVSDPTALAFDSLGRLLVADNGPDQNIKVYRVPTASNTSLPITLVDSIGEKGGVFAGPKPGRTGPWRFWGIRGIGVDSSGKLYVGCTGMPMQVGGGTHIRAFSGMAKTDSLLWELLGLGFVNTVDADPDSAGRSLYKNSTRFHMDWTKPPGKSWSFAAATTDPFRYPDDPRLVHSLEATWFRRIQGKPFLFLTDMYSSYISISRFTDSSEVGIPSLFIPVLSGYRDSGSGVWALDRRPILADKGSGDYRRWIWRDGNGDGQVQASEFKIFDLIYPSTYGFDVDDSGDLWWGGSPYMVQIPTGGLDSNGIPRYPTDSIQRWRVPFRGTQENNDYVMHCRYLRSQDAMILATGVKERMIATIYRYDNWSKRIWHFKGFNVTDTDTLAETWRVTIPYKFPADWNTYLNLQVSDTCLYPFTMTADTDYVYVGYLDKGPDGWRNGEVSLYDAKTGKRSGWIAPGPETAFLSGWFDTWHALNAYTAPTGEKILMAEEDYGGKVNVYRWCPAANCGTPDTTTLIRSSRTTVSYSKGTIHVGANPNVDWSLSIFTLDGKVTTNLSGKGPREVTVVSHGQMCYMDFRTQGRKEKFVFFPR